MAQPVPLAAAAAAALRRAAAPPVPPPPALAPGALVPSAPAPLLPPPAHLRAAQPRLIDAASRLHEELSSCIAALGDGPQKEEIRIWDSALWQSVSRTITRLESEQLPVHATLQGVSYSVDSTIHIHPPRNAIVEYFETDIDIQLPFRLLLPHLAMGDVAERFPIDVHHLAATFYGIRHRISAVAMQAVLRTNTSQELSDLRASSPDYEEAIVALAAQRPDIAAALVKLHRGDIRVDETKISPAYADGLRRASHIQGRRRAAVHLLLPDDMKAAGERCTTYSSNTTLANDVLRVGRELRGGDVLIVGMAKSGQFDTAALQRVTMPRGARVVLVATPITDKDDAAEIYRLWATAAGAFSDRNGGVVTLLEGSPDLILREDPSASLGHSPFRESGRLGSALTSIWFASVARQVERLCAIKLSSLAGAPTTGEKRRRH